MPRLMKVSASVWQKGRMCQDKSAFVRLLDAAGAAGVELEDISWEGAA